MPSKLLAPFFGRRNADLNQQAEQSLAIDPKFDPAFYRSSNADLAEMSDAQLAAHFEKHGRNEGRSPIAGADRESFLRFIPAQGLALEIGPFGRPVLSGEHVRYADVMSTEQMKAVAADHGMDPDKCPTIHYLVNETPLESIDERFVTVFSSHCIEHQTDLLGHLRAVGKLLEPGGSYFVIVPDKRYCFDHFRAESTLGDVFAAHAEKRTRHDLRTLLNQFSLLAHNDQTRHWAGDHGDPAYLHRPQCLEEAVWTFDSAAGAYVDAHAWQFTPESFEAICGALHAQGHMALRPAAVFPTLFNRNEFCAILTRCAVAAGSARRAQAERSDSINST